MALKQYGPQDDARQDAALQKDDSRLAALELRVDELERRAKLLDAVLGAHGERLNELRPLAGLVEFVESIKRYFANIRI